MAKKEPSPEASKTTGFEAFVRAAMSTGKPPPIPKKTKAKKRKPKE